MNDLNQVLLMGRLAQSPSLAYTPAGIAVGHVQLVIQTTRPDDFRREQTKSVFVFVQVRGQTAAEQLMEHQKGETVMAGGTLQNDTFVHGEVILTRLMMVADFLHFFPATK